MAVKTGVSMISFIITKEMRKKASSNSYKLPKAEQKKSGQYKNTQVNNYKPGLISENNRLHDLQRKLKEKRAVQAAENNINK